MPYKILFVCLGNICRSPAAEGVMKALVQQSGKENMFEIDSAGIGGWHVGELPDARMRRHGAARGYRFDSHARQFADSDFAYYDAIYVMDNDNFNALRNRAATTDYIKKVKMLGDYMVNHRNVQVIPDPYYGGDADFEYALDLIEDACAGLLKSFLSKE